MNEFILASGNVHKVEELNKLFHSNIVKVLAPKHKLEVIEDGVSFEENALKKARAYYQEFNLPSVSDDSGLVVNALPGELGIHSARFGGEGLSDKDRYELLLKRLDGSLERTAHFVCVLCFYISDNEYYFFQGKVDGDITSSPEGSDGFGYDPVFRPKGNPEITFATDPDWKFTHSHRASAVKGAEKFFEGYSKSV